MKGLVQIIDCTGGKHPRADLLVRLPGDEHNGDRLTAARKLFLQLYAAHTRHGDVENEASRALPLFGLEELLSRCEHIHSIAELAEQIGQRLTY